MSPANHSINGDRSDAQVGMNRAARRSRGESSVGHSFKRHVVRFGVTGAVLAVGSGAALFFSDGPSSAASASPLADVQPGQEFSQSQAIAAGIFTRQVSTAPDGSTTYTYKYADGTTATEVTPPLDFHPLTASDAELQKYGFPLRPTTTTELASWSKGMAAWTGTVVPNLSVRIGTAVTGKPPTTATTTSPTASLTGQWAGYVARGSGFDGAAAHFAAPNLGAACSGTTPPGLAIWTGLGGSGTPYLLQSGIEAGYSLAARRSGRPSGRLLPLPIATQSRCSQRPWQSTLAT